MPKEENSGLRSVGLRKEQTELRSMSILPLQGPGQAFQAAALAGSAASAATGAFADLLAAFRRDRESAGDSNGSQSAAGIVPARAAESKESRAATLENALETLRSRVDSMLAGFQSTLESLLSEKGVDLSGGVTLEADALGSLRVVGDHPQKGMIETTLAGHPELAEAFRQIETNSSLLGAIRKACTGPKLGEAADGGAIDLDTTGPAQSPLRLRVDGARASVTSGG